MKTIPYSTVILAICAVALDAQAQEKAITTAPGAAKAVHTERVTDAELLALQQQKSSGGIVPKGTLGRTYSLAALSDFITFDGYSSIVPKGAILHVPEGLRPNVVNAPAGVLMVWKEFITRNIGRISLLEVTLEEASGAKPLDEARLEAAARSGRIVVAVIRGNPTSVSRPKPNTP